MNKHALTGPELAHLQGVHKRLAAEDYGRAVSGRWPTANQRDLAALLRALEGKDARAPVELRPIAVCGAPGEGPYVAAVMIAAAGKPPRIVYGDERFTDKAECEAHAVRVANDFAQCRAWNKKHAFTVATREARA